MEDKIKTSSYVAHGAQPAEAELTDDMIKNGFLFTDEEIAKLTHEEFNYILAQPHETVRKMVEETRQKKRLDKEKSK